MDLLSNKQFCNEIALSENYLPFVLKNAERLLQEEDVDLKPVCIHEINELISIMYLKREPVIFTPERLLKYIQLGTIQFPILIGPYAKASLEKSEVLYFHDQPYLSLRGSGVLVGIIDSGIDYTHRVFINEDNKTKILRLWDQTIQGNPPEEFFYGSEFTNEDINAALQSENPYEIVPSKDELGHGTFLAGIAAGREDAEQDFIGAAPDAELIVVKLKQARYATKDFESVFTDAPVYETADFIMGVQYITEQANKMNRPISIIVGLGSNEGSHTGVTLAETYMGQIAEQIGRVVTVAAGNEANLAHHYSGQFEIDENLAEFQNRAKFEINVESGEKGFLVFIWGNSPDKFTLSITSPTGEVVPLFIPRTEKVEQVDLVLERTRLVFSYYMSTSRTVDQLIIIRFMEPTEGLWTFFLYGIIIVNSRFNVWLPREGWIKPGTVFTKPDPYTTVTLPSTTMSVITTGAYHTTTNSIYTSSGRGPTRDNKMRPDLVAPGVNVWGPLPGNRYGLMTGTSIAAAMTGGAATLLLEWGIVIGNDRNMDTRRVKAYLIRGADRVKGVLYPNTEWGYGTLNLRRSFESIRL
jgi:subtilisin family serine protease